jgi:DNA-directed RNA polymerase sigma subunit (sigma70/sigma32)
MAETVSASKVPALSYPIALRLLRPSEEAELAARARRGDMKARQAMMEANIRLVMSIARRYSCKSLFLRGSRPGRHHRAAGGHQQV